MKLESLVKPLIISTTSLNIHLHINHKLCNNSVNKIALSFQQDPSYLTRMAAINQTIVGILSATYIYVHKEMKLDSSNKYSLRSQYLLDASSFSSQSYKVSQQKKFFNKKAL